MQLKSQVSPGLSGFRYEHLQAILFSEDSKTDHLAKLALDDYILYLMISSTTDYCGTSTRSRMDSLTALNKKDIADPEIDEVMDFCPICKGEAIKESDNLGSVQTLHEQNKSRM